MIEKTKLTRVTGLWFTEDKKSLEATQRGVKYTAEPNPNKVDESQPKARLFRHEIIDPDAEKVELTGLWTLKTGKGLGGTKDGTRYLIFPNSYRHDDKQPNCILYTADANESEVDSDQTRSSGVQTDHKTQVIDDTPEYDDYDCDVDDDYDWHLS